MKKEDIVVFGLEWLAANMPQLERLLLVFLPVLAFAILGYFLHLVAQLIAREKGEKK